MHPEPTQQDQSAVHCQAALSERCLLTNGGMRRLTGLRGLPKPCAQQFCGSAMVVLELASETGDADDHAFQAFMGPYILSWQIRNAFPSTISH